MAEDPILKQELATDKTTQPNARSPATFSALSPELKDTIISYIIRPTDLQNVCIVSHELHEIAVRYLYNEITLDLGSTNDHRLAAFLRQRNIGLQHIRCLRLHLADYNDHCSGKEGQAHFAIKMLLEFLPEDILESFSWNPWRPFQADNLLLLYRKQRRMDWLEVMDTDRDILPDIEKDEKLQSTIFSHATRLALYPENQTSLNRGGYFVKKAADKMESLIINADFSDTDQHGESTQTIEARELNDSASGPGLLTRTVFGHLLPFEECTPLAKLTSITLHDINLRYASDTWCKVINFQQCQILRLRRCPGVDSLLSQLCKASNLPKKLGILEIEHRDVADNEALLALDGFLCLAQGIRELIIALQCVKSLPSPTGIVRQGKTLNILNVHASGEPTGYQPILGRRPYVTEATELVWSAEDFKRICRSCRAIEQLSCAWPTTEILKEPSAGFLEYQMQAMRFLKKLVTLNITTWPTCASGSLLPRTIYEQLIQRLACLLFQQVTIDPTSTSTDAEEREPVNPVNLRLIAFGISDKIDDREDSRNQYIYLRSTAKDSLGKEIVHAAKIGWCLRKYIEPRSEVLDFVLARKARLPIRPDHFDLDDDDSDN